MIYFYFSKFNIDSTKKIKQFSYNLNCDINNLTIHVCTQDYQLIGIYWMESVLVHLDFRSYKNIDDLNKDLLKFRTTEEDSLNADILFLIIFYIVILKNESINNSTKKSFYDN